MMLYREQLVRRLATTAMAVRVEKLGWMTGFEPATSGATVRRSTAELHPPQGNAKAMLKSEG